MFSDDYREAPSWLDDLGPFTAVAGDLPESTDVLVIGSGYTGLSAALQTARGGRKTVVIDSADMGHGCSTRNGGQISTSIKPTLQALTKMVGAEKARAVRQEGVNALNWIEDFIRTEEIDCDFKRAGRFHAAHTPGHYEALARSAEQVKKDEGIDSIIVPRSEQRRELGTDSYFGGVVYTRHASVHPAKYHRGMLGKVAEAGAILVPHCAATGLVEEADGVRVITAKGEIRARDVVVATNGYTTNLTPWLKRRIIPIGSYIIATEELPRELVDELFPTDRIASDTCRVVYYYRASPDRKRIVFGGRVSADEVDPRISGPLLHKDMVRIFPQLQDVRISRSWLGTVAYSFDELAHIGSRGRIHYAMSYCGSGVSMASYLGMRTGQKILGLAEGKTGFDGMLFPTRPFYTGNPWFLPWVVSWYRWRDQQECRKALGTRG
ncbi:NAD(P)/FAD-dependent oxidoreductase [Hwanghaeella sp.]|uniref:NAD(P)/FAD-dependent oxidoreductase n=1 Tax=Hwanghaeella sp. TaxID=2605943 RepID=UPI003CCB956F